MAATVVQAARDLRPQADVDMAANGLVNLRAPTAANDSARKADVDAVATSVSTANGNISTLNATVASNTTAIAGKAPLTGPTFTGTATGSLL